MVFDFLRRGAAETVEQKASATGPVVAYQTSGRVAWSPRDSVSLTRSGFCGNPVGFRSVKLIAEAAAALPLVVQDAARRFDEHPLMELMRRPNAGQGRAELLEALYGQMLLSGDGYVEAVGGEGGVPVELHVLRSDRMSVVPGADGWPVAYEYAVGGRKHRFDASRWSKALLDNAARPSGAIVYRGAEGQGKLSEDQYDRLVSEMESHHQGARNAGRPMLLEGGLDWKPMGFSPSDMEFQKTKESAAREIALAFGVPPMLIGVQGDASYANYQEAHRAFYRLSVLPLATRVTAALADWLSGYLGEAVSLKPDLDQVPALAAERDAQWARVSAAAFLSDAEKRALLGLPAVANDA